MERMLRVHRVKFAGPGFSSMSPEGGKRRGEADCGNGVRAGERRAERLQTG